MQSEQSVLDIWFDQDNLRAGLPWEQQLFQNLRPRDLVLLFVSQNSLQSWYVRLEFEYALQHGIQVLPLLLQRVDLGQVLEIAPEHARKHMIAEEQARHHLERFYTEVSRLQYLDFRSAFANAEQRPASFAELESRLEEIWNEHLMRVPNLTKPQTKDSYIREALTSQAIHHPWAVNYMHRRAKALIDTYEVIQAANYCRVLRRIPCAHAENAANELKAYAEIRLHKALQYPIIEACS